MINKDIIYIHKVCKKRFGKDDCYVCQYKNSESCPQNIQVKSNLDMTVNNIIKATTVAYECGLVDAVKYATFEKVYSNYEGFLTVCSNCGKELFASSNYCNNCGCKFEK